MDHHPEHSNKKSNVSTRHLANGQTSSIAGTAPRNRTANHTSKSQTLASPSQGRTHDLQGVGGQFQGGGQGLPSHRPAISRTAAVTSTCPYNQDILELRKRSESSAGMSNSLDSYLVGELGGKYALYYVDDTSVLSTTKSCNCIPQRDYGL